MSTTPAERLARALAAIDAANRDDPNTIVIDGAPRPKELAHAERVSHWVRKLAPGAGEALLLAARAHHLRRWEVPRSRFPEGRRGYHRWRLAAHAHHAEQVGRILDAQGYEAEVVVRVQDLVRKRDLGRDPEVQVLEDALCLVFVETQLGDLARRLEAERLDDVLRKTLAKMSPAAIGAALALPLDPEERQLLERAAAARSDDAPG